MTRSDFIESWEVKKDKKIRLKYWLVHVRDSVVAINEVIANKKINLTRFTELSLMDDETYGATHELKPLPKC